jgi:hypothetical protein
MKTSRVLVLYLEAAAITAVERSNQDRYLLLINVGVAIFFAAVRAGCCPTRWRSGCAVRN